MSELKQTSQWIAALQQALVQERTETIPEGFQTIRQIAREIGQSTESAGRHIRKLTEQGRVQRQMFRSADSFGRLVAHYKLKKP